MLVSYTWTRFGPAVGIGVWAVFGVAISAGHAAARRRKRKALLARLAADMRLVAARALAAGERRPLNGR